MDTALPMRRWSVGDAGVGLTRHPKLDDRMVAAFTVTVNGGRRLIIDLTLDDTRNLFNDLVQLLGANREQVDAWWQRLADNRDGRPKAAVRHAG